MIPFTDGYLVELPREEAKSFFGAPTEDDRLQLVTRMLQQPKHRRVNCRALWQPLHEVLAGMEQANAVLHLALLGGRSIQATGDARLYMVRPDLVRAVAEQLEQLDQSDLTRVRANLDPMKAANLIQEIAQFYRAAADSGSAVVFAAK